MVVVDFVVVVVDSSSLTTSNESVMDSTNDGNSLSNDCSISSVPIKSSEEGVFDLSRSVGKGSPG